MKEKEEKVKKKSDKSKKKIVVALVAILVFVLAGVGTYFAIKHFSKPKEETEVHEETPAEEKKEEPKEEKKEEEKKEEEDEEEDEGEETDDSDDEPGSSPYAGNPGNANGTNSSTTYNAVAHEIDGVKYVYYKTLVWGSVETNFQDFRTKVAETLNDSRGWVRANLRFVEVTSGQDLNIIISDADSLEGYNGYCSGSLSCTSGYNEVIINDDRWRFGTDETSSMSTRDYQHMVLNHEVGHWLGHYSHIEACDEDGDVAPIMLQQSTGLRNCGSFNSWPLDFELWTLR